MFIADMVMRLGLAKCLSNQVKVKKRQRGSSDHQKLMSLTSSYCYSNGHLSSVDALSYDAIAYHLPGVD